MRRRVLALSKALPKTELHLHLDGSLSTSFIAQSAAKRGIELPCRPQRLRNHLHQHKVAARRSPSGGAQRPGGNWGVFDFCNRFLQSEEELREASREIAMRCASENVWIVELRFCPALHTLEGLTERQAVTAVCAGLSDALADAPGLRAAGAILCALRSMPAAHGVATVDLATQCRSAGQRVLGVDIAGDEGAFPLALHAPALARAREVKLPLTVHAGEWPHPQYPSILENVALALAYGARRIGHGVALAHPDARELLQRVAGASNAAGPTTVEICMTSNVGSERFAPARFETHPVRTLVDHGVSVAISSDNLLLSGREQLVAAPSLELARLIDLVGFSAKEVRDVLVSGARASFCPGAADVAAAFALEVDRVLADPSLSLTRLS